MAHSLWLTRLIFPCFYCLIGIVLVSMREDFCGRFFETRQNHVLVGHNTSSILVGDEFECQVKCIATKTCQSFNVHHATGKADKRVCELNNITRQMKQSDFKAMKGSNYYGSIKVTCVDISHEKGRKYTDSTRCHTGYKGKRCQPTRGLYSHLPAESCKDILDSGDSFGDGKYWIDPKKTGNPLKVYCDMTTNGATRGLYSHLPAESCKDILDSGDSFGDGKYWIDPKKTGNPLKVYCDMTTNGGGWLLLSSLVMKSSTPPAELPVKTSYLGIASNEMVLSKTALKELFAHLPFRQIRFYCSKKLGRTFHVGTVTNSSGESVVRYFAGQTDVRPSSCGSFLRMENDNSMLATACQSWHDGKWGHPSVDEMRSYNHVAFVSSTYHWLLDPPSNRWECDDFNKGVSAGDFWKIYVR